LFCIAVLVASIGNFKSFIRLYVPLKSAVAVDIEELTNALSAS
jgi:hypothetical protein